MLRHSCCVGNHVLIGASALLLVLQNFCLCFGTPDWCSGTPASATALLLREQTRPNWCSGTPAGATTLLLREQARPDRCSGTPAGATTLLFRGQACPVRCYDTPVLYRTFGYLLYCVLLISYNWSR